MGSLTSQPAIPRVQQPVTTVSPVASISPTPTPSTTQTEVTASVSSTTPSEPVSDEDIETARREAGLLSRQRGQLSTILTGFKGFLSDEIAGSARKTLLGE